MTRSWLTLHTSVMGERALTVFPFLLSWNSECCCGCECYLARGKLCKPLALIYMHISLMCCLGSNGRNYSANLRAHCSWPRWLHLGKVKRFLSVLWTWSVRELLVTVDQLAIQYDWPGQEIFKFLMHGWRRRDGGTSKRQRCRLLMHANMAAKVSQEELLSDCSWSSHRDWKWTFYLMLLLRYSISLWCYSCTVLFCFVSGFLGGHLTFLRQSVCRQKKQWATDMLQRSFLPFSQRSATFNWPICLLNMTLLGQKCSNPN